MLEDMYFESFLLPFQIVQRSSETRYLAFYAQKIVL